MTLSRQEWLERFGRCEMLPNTPEVRAELELCVARDQQFRLWSELERTCEDGEYFAGTRWSEIILGVDRHAVRFYRREKPAQWWVLVAGGIQGRRNRNWYFCGECGCQWSDEYPGAPDDDCDRCGSRHCQPWQVDELDAEGELVQRHTLSKERS